MGKAPNIFGKQQEFSVRNPQGKHHRTSYHEYKHTTSLPILGGTWVRSEDSRGARPSGTAYLHASHGYTCLICDPGWGLLAMQSQ